MLILVAVTVKTVVGSGLFSHTSKATSSYSMHEAREQLGTTLASAMVEKHNNKDYNQNEFLNEYIKANLKEAKIYKNIILIDGWLFEIDREKLEITSDLGKGNPEDFREPEVNITKGTLAEDKLSIIINITALESKNGIYKIEIYGEDKNIPLETFNYSYSKLEINESYNITTNGKYKIKVYSKLQTEKSIEITEIEPQVPIGAYVRYTPTIAEDYQMEAKYTGYTSDEIIPQDTDLKWQFLTINENGSIELISNRPTNKEVSFSGVLGYNNGVLLLNDLCKMQYSNSNLGAVGRSMNLIDINSKLNESGISARNNYRYNNVLYGSAKTYRKYILYTNCSCFWFSNLFSRRYDSNRISKLL